MNERVVHYANGRRAAIVEKRRHQLCASGAQLVSEARRGFRETSCQLPRGERHGRYYAVVGKTSIEGQYEQGAKAGVWQYRRGDALSIVEYEAGEVAHSQRFYYAGDRQWGPCAAAPTTARVERLCGPDAAASP